jgi:hypothetical protein
MLERPAKFIGVPALVIAAGAGAGLGTWFLFPQFRLGRMALENIQLDQLSVPLVLWANLYALWNLYHAGAQNFGLFCLYRRRGFRGWVKLGVLALFVLGVVLGGHELPRLIALQVAFLFCFGLFTVNHWTAAIGLAAHVHANHTRRSPLWFVGAVFLAGALLFWAFSAALTTSVHLAILALSLRGALGIWHFLQDRWIWKLSNPRVRATIGVDILPDAVGQASSWPLKLRRSANRDM